MAGLLAGTVIRAEAPGPRVFATADEAAHALIDAVKANEITGFVALFGPRGQELIDTSDAATGRRNRDVFLAAVAEGAVRVVAAERHD